MDFLQSVLFSILRSTEKLFNFITVSELFSDIYISGPYSIHNLNIPKPKVKTLSSNILLMYLRIQVRSVQPLLHANAASIVSVLGK